MGDNKSAQQPDVNEQIKVRMEKLKNLQDAGKDPFQITKYDVTHHTDEIRAIYEAHEKELLGDRPAVNTEGLDEQQAREAVTADYNERRAIMDASPINVSFAGRMMFKRVMGKASFCNIADLKGRMQAYISRDAIGEEAYADFKKSDIGDIFGIKGFIFRTKTGEISVHAEEITLLSKSLQVLPEKFHGITDTDMRYRQRYVDLIMNPDVKETFVKRSKIIKEIRKFLDGRDFMEVETPMLGKSTPEGARDYLVPSRVHPGHFYGLPQSPQLYKQLLMCSGYDRYIQIARCFRDEDLRADRQPEFTQIDMELSFVDVDDVIDVNERFLAYLFKEVLDIDVKLPIQRITWQEAMDRFGSDKPDLRFGMELQNVSDIVKDCGFGVFTGALENGGSVRGINAKGQGSMPRKKIDALVDFAKGYGAKGLAYIAIHEDGSYKSSFAKFMTENQMNALVKAMDGEAGDLLLFAADRNKIVWNVLGALRVELADQMGLLDKSDYKFLWVTEFPQFEWSDEEERYVAMHHPFTMPMDEDLDMLETNPGAVRAKAYDIVLNGTEIGGGSVRIHQADVQSRMFKALGLTDEVANEKFGFLLDAFKYGVPPHAGLAYGLDRLVMLMAKRDSIRDVIAFPKVKDASCLLTNAPDVVDAKQLDELLIKIEEEKTEE